MAGFTLDTSGAVIDRSTDLPARPVTRWTDLSPFEQGYVEAVFASARTALQAERERRFKRFVTSEVATCPDGERFSDLAPETLAAIRKDCAAFLAAGLGFDEVEHGRRFWYMRVKRQIGGGWHPNFPPLTLTLGDDGKVYQREAGQ